MMSLWDALRMNMMISYQELVRTFPRYEDGRKAFHRDISLVRKYFCSKKQEGYSQGL